MTAASSAQDSVTLPLQGYFHPGRYMPVHVAITPGSAGEESFGIRSRGCVWTYLKYSGGRVDTTVPWLVIDARALGATWNSLPRIGATPLSPALRPLGEHERIIGFAGVGSAEAAVIAEQVYPGDRTVLIGLDPSQPLAGAAAAWETLDLVALDVAAARRISESHFGALVACGVAFAVRGEGGGGAEGPPWTRWPWKPASGMGAGRWSVLHFRPAGPIACTYDPALFEPAAGVRPGRTWELRRLVVGASALFSIVMLLLALWRPRFVGVLAVLFSGASVAGLSVWGHWQLPIVTVSGKIRIIGPDLTQDDDWAYQTTDGRSRSIVRWVDISKPMFASPAQLDYSDCRVVCYPNGDPDFFFLNLAAGGKSAFLARRGGPQAPTITPSPRITSPLARLVRSRYLAAAGEEIVGEMPMSPLVGEPYGTAWQWPGLIVRRR